MNNRSQVSWYSSQYLNVAPPEYKAVALSPCQPTQKVIPNPQNALSDNKTLNI